MLQAVSLPARASVLKDLAGAMQRFVTMERVAWGLNDQTEPPPAPLEGIDEDVIAQRIAMLVTQVKIPVDALPPELRGFVESARRESGTTH